MDDLLDVTRMDRNKIQLQCERLELNELAQRTFEDYHAAFQQAELRAVFEPAPLPIYVSGDWNRLAQVVGNLLQNAITFTPPEGRVTVTVSSGSALGQAALEVADTGTGLAPEIKAHLFEPFVQADMTLDRSQGGLGPQSDGHLAGGAGQPPRKRFVRATEAHQGRRQPMGD